MFDAPATASGPFALGSIIGGRQKVMAETRFGSGSYRSGRSGKLFNFKSRRAKSEDDGDGGGDGGNMGMVNYSSSEESDDERVDVEYISLLDDEHSGGEDGDTKIGSAWGAGVPVRIARMEHVDRQAMVNTDASTRKSKSELKAMKDKEMTFETDIKIKEEVDDDEMMPPPPPTDPLSSPEQSKRRVKIMDSPEAKKSTPSSSPSKSRRRAKKPVISTTEEREEYERFEADRIFVLKELGGELPDIKVKTKDADGDIDMTAPHTLHNVETENQIFFFQFPPLLPHLIPMNNTKKDENSQDGETSNPPIKPESGTMPKKGVLKGKAALKAQLALLTEPPPPGLVGKLRVHKSGKVTMLWGNPAVTTTAKIPAASKDRKSDGNEQEAVSQGSENEEAQTEYEAEDIKDGPIEMFVSRGADCEFLQEVVVIKETSPYGDDDVDDIGRPRGVVYSMGQVKGKYIVSPNFDKLIVAGKTTTGRQAKMKTENTGDYKGKGKEAILMN